MSKGSAPRPFEVDHETYSNNFDAIFGKKKVFKEIKQCWMCGDLDSDFQKRCTVPNCGMKEQQ